jgi:hypothetical protein
MATISRAGWAAVGNPAQKRRLLQGRNDYNWARRRLAWDRRREVYHLWYRWRAKFGPHRGLQALIADHIKISRATISRDFAALGLRAGAWEP